MTVDKNYCMSSYLAFRYIEDADKDFFPGMHHQIKNLPRMEDRIKVKDEHDIDLAIRKQIDALTGEKLGIMLSGGMDSAILATYMPKGSIAYTFRFKNGQYENEELKRAEAFADICGLELHYVDIDWNQVNKCLPDLMKRKCAPVHSIEPQIFIAAQRAKEDGVTKMIIGDAADYVFYGMDGLLSRDWKFDDFVRRASYIMPEEVLKSPSDIRYLFERYRQGDDIDFIGFYDKSITEESYDSYHNALMTAGLSYIDPYEYLLMADKVDLSRIRGGESKYLVRALFMMRYPNMMIPEKHPMPRPVDEYFRNWEGPRRKEFRENIDISQYSGNQKWLLYCLETFLNAFEQ